MPRSTLQSTGIILNIGVQSTSYFAFNIGLEEILRAYPDKDHSALRLSNDDGSLENHISNLLPVIEAFRLPDKHNCLLFQL